MSKDKTRTDFAQAWHGTEEQPKSSFVRFFDLHFVWIQARFWTQQILNLVNFIAPVAAGVCFITAAMMYSFLPGTMLLVVPLILPVGLGLSAIAMVSTLVTYALNKKQIKEEGYTRPTLPQRYLRSVISGILTITGILLLLKWNITEVISWNMGKTISVFTWNIGLPYVAAGAALIICTILLAKIVVAKRTGEHTTHWGIFALGAASSVILSVPLFKMIQFLGTIGLSMPIIAVLSMIPFTLVGLGYFYAQYYSARKKAATDKKILGISSIRSVLGTVFEQNVLNIRTLAPAVGAMVGAGLLLFSLGIMPVLTAVAIGAISLAVLGISARILYRIFVIRWKVSNKTIKHMEKVTGVISKEERLSGR